MKAKRLDALGTAMLAITNERMHVSISDPAVSALRGDTLISAILPSFPPMTPT